jgi:hypothetical protein
MIPKLVPESGEWVIRIPVSPTYTHKEASRILGLHHVTVTRRVDRGVLEVDGEGRILHASVVEAIRKMEAVAAGERYRRMMLATIHHEVGLEPDKEEPK